MTSDQAPRLLRRKLSNRRWFMGESHGRRSMLGAFLRLLPRVCPFVQRNEGMRRFPRLRSGASVRREAVRIDQAHTSRVSKSMRGSITV